MRIPPINSQESMKSLTLQYAGRDVMAGVVVYLVALPLCLGVALASGAPLASGIIAGVLGGIVVGLLSGSHTSVAGPAAGLTAVVAVQISQLGSFEAFLVAVVLAGVMQVALGIARAGFISSFFPNSVIKGLLAAIGVILILKQIPHLLGHDQDPEGEMSFQQPDGENSITELLAAFFDIQPGAVLISVLSILILVYWDKVKVLKAEPRPLGAGGGALRCGCQRGDAGHRQPLGGDRVASGAGARLGQRLRRGGAAGVSGLVHPEQLGGLHGGAHAGHRGHRSRPCSTWTPWTSSTPSSGARRPTASSWRRASATSWPA
jgi:hypothetical protein